MSTPTNPYDPLVNPIAHSLWVYARLLKRMGVRGTHVLYMVDPGPI